MRTNYVYEGIPVWDYSQGFVYVVGFGATAAQVQRVKVGMTRNPDQRVNEIIRQCSWGLPAPVIWVSPPHSGYRETERLLLQWCDDQYDEWSPCLWSAVGRERFTDLDPHAVIEHAKYLVAATALAA